MQHLLILAAACSFFLLEDFELQSLCWTVDTSQRFAFMVSFSDDPAVNEFIQTQGIKGWTLPQIGTLKAFARFSADAF